MIASEFAFVGRFQPFHLGHWEIVSGLLQRAERLYIGITNPDIRSLSQQTSSPHRHVQAANPFTFHERLRMISSTIGDAQHSRCPTHIVPFPLDDPSLWHNYIPASATQVVRVFSDWEAEKITLLQKGGYKVETLIGSASEKIAASDIRAAIVEDRRFLQWLPKPVAAQVDSISVARIRSRMLEDCRIVIDDRLPILLVLLDGLGDRGCPALGGQTPAEAADTPLLDSLAANGVSALHVPFGPGRSTSSETAHWDLFGFANQAFAGRALLEALGQGLQPPMNTPLFQVALRAGEQRENKIWLGARARRGRDEDDAEALFSALQGQRIDGIDFELLPLRTGECVLLAHNGPSHEVSDSDALFDHIHPWMQPLAWSESREPAAAQVMARALCRWLQTSYQRLCEHPVNRRRDADGLARLDVPVSKWASWHADTLPSFEQQVGIRGAAVTDTALYRGFARLLDMPFTDIAYDASDPAADMAMRVDAANALLDDSPFVHLHIKATDEAGHSKIPERKRDVIEATERGLAGLTIISERAIVAITGDHATPSVGTLLHSGDPTPLVVTGPGIRPDRVKQFGERHARDGDYGLLAAADILPLLAGFANRPFFRGHRPGASATLALPDHPLSMPFNLN